MITRIRELLEARQLSPTQFADLIGVGRPVISHILSERNKPSLEVVQKIISAFPDISLPWLLAGTGPMLATAAATAPTALPAAAETPQRASPAVPIAASAAVPPTPAPITRPTAPTHSVAASQPGSYPRPPRFQPGAIAAAIPASIQAPPSPIEASVSAADSGTTTPTLPSPSPLPPPAATPVIGPAVPAPAPVPLSPPSPRLPPVTNESLGTVDSLATPAAEVSAPPASPEVAASPNPAAALSFLGEPGKAIRRIVIFYRDGSFSDYLPEGN